MRERWPLEGIFGILERVFKIHWSAREWSFRVELDMWIVYAGMIASIAVSKLREYRITDDHRWPIIQKAALAASVAGLVWFFAFELYQESKFAYNAWHPWISIIPVLAFAFLRNGSVILRSASSGFFAFIGKCSLETFILQYHFWLAGDTKGVLLAIPGTRLRPLNFVVTTIMFIYLSDRMAWATGELTTRICAIEKAGQAPATTLPAPTTTAQRPDTRNDEEEQELLVPPKDEENGESIPLEPDTPVRPGRRWIDRLAEAPRPAPSSPQRLGERVVAWFTGTLKGHITLIMLAMWILNVVWTP